MSTLVQGDTTTAFAAALASYYRRVKVGHVEAGLRSYDRFKPYPEEVNHVMTAAVSDLHFCPTAGAREALLTEHIRDSTIRVVGNTVIDALHVALESRWPATWTCTATATPASGSRTRWGSAPPGRGAV